MTMARYLVTGGGGFIGSNLTEALMRKGARVRVVDDFSSGRRANLVDAPAWAAAGRGELELVEGDLRDAELCGRVVAGADYVLHQAAIPSVQRSVDDPARTNEVNVTATLQLLDAARQQGVQRFVFASSSSVYGESEVLPKAESMPPAPMSPYALQKWAAETYCALYHRLYGLPTVSLRYFNVFGPRQDPASEYSAVVPRFVDAIRGGRRPVIYGDGEQTRDFTFVANAVRANLLACEAGPDAWGKAFNVGSGSRISLNQLLRQIGELTGLPAAADHGDPRPGDVRHSLASLERASSVLGYRVEVDLQEGLRRTLEAS